METINIKELRSLIASKSILDVGCYLKVAELKPGITQSNRAPCADRAPTIAIGRLLTRVSKILRYAWHMPRLDAAAGELIASSRDKHSGTSNAQF